MFSLPSPTSCVALTSPFSNTRPPKEEGPEWRSKREESHWACICHRGSYKTARRQHPHWAIGSNMQIHLRSPAIDLFPFFSVKLVLGGDLQLPLFPFICVLWINPSELQCHSLLKIEHIFQCPILPTISVKKKVHLPSNKFYLLSNF